MDVRRIRHARRRLAFWGGLIIASVVGLQLLARALSEFSLPDVTHPCLLLDAKGIAALKGRIEQRPWRELWAATVRMAEERVTGADWLRQGRVARANAVVYVVADDGERGERAARLLRRYPKPLYASRLSCSELARAAACWAETADLLYGYLRRHHELALAWSAVARLGHRLYYTDWRKDRAWRTARLWRAVGLIECGLALAGWEPPPGLSSPRLLYAEGRAELRAAIRDAFGATGAENPKELAAAFEALVPAAIAIRRAAGDNVLDVEEVRAAARWVMAAEVGAGRVLGTKGRAVCFPVYLPAAAGIYPQAFCREAERAILAGRMVRDPARALCLLPEETSYQLPAGADAAALDGAFALAVGKTASRRVVLVAARPAFADRQGRCVKVRFGLWDAYEGVQGRLELHRHKSSEAASKRGILARFEPFPRPVRRPDVEVRVGAAGDVCAVAQCVTRGQDEGVAVKWLLMDGPAVIVCGKVLAHEQGRPQVSLRVAPGRWAVAELGTKERCAVGQESCVISAGRRQQAMRFIVALYPRKLRWRLVEAERGLHYALEGPGLPATWHLLVAVGAQRAELECDEVAADARMVMWREEEGKVAGVVVVDGKKLTVGEQVVWESETEKSAWWAPGVRTAAVRPR